MPPSKPPTTAHEYSPLDAMADITDPEREAVAKAAKAASQADEPQLPTRPEGMSREVWIQTGRFGPDTLRRIGIEYAQLLDGINPSVMDRVSSLLSSDKLYAELLCQVENYAAELDNIDAEPSKYETIGLDTKAISQTADPILPTRPTNMTREDFVQTGGFVYATLVSLTLHYCRQLDRIDTLPVLPNQPLGTDPDELIHQVHELQRVVTEQVAAIKVRVEPCPECKTWEKRRDNAEKAAKAWQFSSEENLKLRQQEKQKNTTIREEIVEFHEELDIIHSHLTDIISQADRDDGVEVDHAPDSVVEAPWTGVKRSPELCTDERGVLSNGGYKPLMRMCVLSKKNYDFACHCVNCHDELLAVAIAAWGESLEVRTIYCLSAPLETRIAAIISKAEATP